MSIPQEALLVAIESTLTGAPGIDAVIRGALEDVQPHQSANGATVGLDYGELAPQNTSGLQSFGGYRGDFDVRVVIYWNGPASVWEARLWAAYAEAWRRIMALSGIAGVLAIHPVGHEAPEIGRDGDAQHVMLRATFRAVISTNYGNPEA